jgi:hypothetical protein
VTGPGATAGTGGKYSIIAVSKHVKVALDQATGKLTFDVAKGHYGVFTCDLQYGNEVVVVHYTVKRSKSSQPACVA